MKRIPDFDSVNKLMLWNSCIHNSGSAVNARQLIEWMTAVTGCFQCIHRWWFFLINFSIESGERGVPMLWLKTEMILSTTCLRSQPSFARVQEWASAEATSWVYRNSRGVLLEEMCTDTITTSSSKLSGGTVICRSVVGFSCAQILQSLSNNCVIQHA